MKINIFKLFKRKARVAHAPTYSKKYLETYFTMPFKEEEPSPDYIKQAPGSGLGKYDPIENSKEYRSIIRSVEKEVRWNLLQEDIQLDGKYRLSGSCHWYWGEKKSVLKKKGIVWYTPSQMNPGIMYD